MILEKGYVHQAHVGRGASGDKAQVSQLMILVFC